MISKKALFGGVCALALLLGGGVGAEAATGFVAPLQTYACSANTWAATLTASTGATTCTGFGSVGAGTVLGNATGSSAAPTFNSTPVLGVAGTGTGTLGFSGTTSGTVTIQPQSAAGTWNFNLPITAGTAGQVLTSQGGASTAMTWTTVASAGFTVSTKTTGYTVASVTDDA